MAWEPSSAASAAVSQMMRDELKPLDLAPFTNWLAVTLPREETRHVNAEHFAATLVDMAHLLEEFRFEVGVGTSYLYGLRAELAELNKKHTTGMGAMALSPGAAAFLTPYMIEPPDPSVLFREPAQGMTGLRLLGGWWAGQIFDSALTRGFSVLDRLAILLFCTDGQDMSKVAPAFRESWLSKLKAWRDRSEWAELTALLTSPLFEWVRDSVRNGFVHRTRLPLELHGAHTTFLPNEAGKVELFQGVTADDHLSIMLAFYNDVMTKACAAAGALIEASTPTTETAP